MDQDTANAQADRGDAAASSGDAPTFEQALNELETIVRSLESGDAPLDKSIELFERGTKLRSQCQARLDEARARIEAIVPGGDGSASDTRPFDSE